MNFEEIKKIVNSELYQMKNENFIDEETYERVINASEAFYQNKVQQKILKDEQIKSEKQRVYEEKIMKKEQNIQDRKTSVLLNLGVIFLFLAGLIFATTNWNSLGMFGKVISVTFMGAILAIGSTVAESKLFLKKTGFALWLLMTLYIPIVGITFMFSLVWSAGIPLTNTESLLGITLISVISSAINIISLSKYKGRYYTWSSYITLELSALFFAGLLQLRTNIIFLISTLAIFVVFYWYKKIKDSDIKQYTGQYLIGLSWVTITVSMILSGIFDNNLIYLIEYILLFLISILISDKLKNIFLGITSILYLGIESIQIFNFYKLDIWIFLVPGIMLFAIYLFKEVFKLHNYVRFTSIGISFIFLTLSILSDTPMALIGAAAVIVGGYLAYKSNDFSEKERKLLRYICGVILPIYTYILILKVPFVVINELSVRQALFSVCGSAIILSGVQFAISNKELTLKLCFSKVSLVIMIIVGIVSLHEVETMMLMIIALFVIEIIGLYKNMNKAAYILNALISTTLLYFIFDNYSKVLTLVALIVLMSIFIILSLIDKRNKNFISLISSVFLMAATVILCDHKLLIIISLLLAVGMIFYSLKNEDNHSLLIFSLVIGIVLLFLPEMLAPNIDKDSMISIIISIEGIFAVILSYIGSIYFESLIDKEKGYDSLTISSIIIIIASMLFSFESGLNILLTTIPIVAVALINIKKLLDSVILKTVLAARILLAYVQIVFLLDVSIVDGMLAIPILIGAILSRYWIFDKNKNSYGDMCEKILLIILNMKILETFFRYDMMNSIIVISIGIIVMVISYSKKIKVYFITSIVMIGLPLLKSTLSFWLLIPWWLYLVIIGLFLLTLGSIAEKNKTGIKSISKLFFNDWK